MPVFGVQMWTGFEIWGSDGGRFALCLGVLMWEGSVLGCRVLLWEGFCFGIWGSWIAQRDEESDRSALGLNCPQW